MTEDSSMHAAFDAWSRKPTPVLPGEEALAAQRIGQETEPRAEGRGAP